MNQIFEILKSAKLVLKSVGIDSYSLDAEILLAHALGKNREYLIANHFKEIDDSDFQLLLARRIAREPISQIIGKKEFWGLDFIVNQHTLTPRPDSEILVEVALQLAPQNILDLGSGTGCLIISLLKSLQNSTGIAVDISQEALLIAKANADFHQVDMRCQFIKSNWMEKVEGKFDLIISNPPYIRKSDIELLQAEVKLYDPIMALTPGDSGLEAYEKIISQAKNYLTISGSLIFEIGQYQENAIIKIANNYGFKLHSIHKDLANINRCLVLI